jgi:hypothetical protein
MFNPYQGPPPLPGRGDETPDATYHGVGKVVSTWEAVEFEFSRLYSVFSNDPDGESLRQYSESTISRYRLDELGKQAERYFLSRPCQQVEGQFDRLVASARALLSRRNEVAHGIVSDMSKITAYSRNFVREARGRPQWALFAPYHTLRQHGDNGLPQYAYTGAVLLVLAEALFDFYEEVRAFRLSLLPPAQRAARTRPLPAKRKALSRSLSPKRGRRPSPRKR